MSEYIFREITPQILEAREYFQVIVVTGPRQSGKTRLCTEIFSDYKYVNLEDIGQRALATEDPIGFIDSLGGKAIIDEVQNVPDILSMIQVRIDANPEYSYILTGSCDFALMKSITQSLAGRAALFTLLPFSLKEAKNMVKDLSIDKIILKGLYPKVISGGVPYSIYYRNYYNTYVERDLRDLLKVKNLLVFDKFVRLLASRIGSEINASSLSREVGVSSVTIKEWLSLLFTSYIAFPLMPYFNNVSKQLVKMPKIYFYDTGLVCSLLGIDSDEKLSNHYMRGALFENLAVCELIKSKYNDGLKPNLYFYRDKGGLEVDVVDATNSDLHLYEIKANSTFKSNFTNNMKALSSEFSSVKECTVIYDGTTIGRTAINIKEI